MSLHITAKDTLNLLAQSLVMSHQYASTDDALRDIALAAVRNKVSYYQRRIRALECKHQTDFEAFTSRLEGSASPADEDDWLAWRSARRMKADWEQVYRELRDERAR